MIEQVMGPAAALYKGGDLNQPYTELESYRAHTNLLFAPWIKPSRFNSYRSFLLERTGLRTIGQ